MTTMYILYTLVHNFSANMDTYKKQLGIQHLVLHI